MNEAQILFLLPLIMNTFGSCACCHLLFLQFRQYKLGRPAWGGWPWRAITLTFTISYLYHASQYLALTFSNGATGVPPSSIRLAWAVARPLCGPLVMQLFYGVERERLRRTRLWQAMIYAGYAITVPVTVLWSFAVLGAALPRSRGLAAVLIAGSDGILAVGLIFATVAIWAARRPEDSKFRRRQRQWYAAIFLTALAFLALELLGWPPWISVIYHLLPLALLVVTVYYGERLMFFDVFVKRGALFFLALVMLAAYIALTSPYLGSQRQMFLKPWVAALALLPFILATPWLYSKLNSWIDYRWLGRHFSVLDAAKFFFKDLHGAVSEEDLLESAESTLSQIFRARVCIDRIDGAYAATAEGLRTPLRIQGKVWGTVHVLPRTDEVPFFSEDAELLRILVDSFGAMLENQRLRDQNLAREQREQQLAVSAAESKLKALRAQINPHFFFNALNTTAALIPQKPDQAEQVLEQLAEVFHYAVRRSECEWVRIAEEISFVRSYLNIEQARFGDRLRVQIFLDKAVENARIPALVIQTLAENAIKHGIATGRAPGVVTISARLLGDKVLVAVTDTGPGFNGMRVAGLLPKCSSGGYGLKNVEERLCAHFGPESQLRFTRDAADKATVVSFEVPLINDAGAAP